jgi:hypothetical protein
MSRGPLAMTWLRPHPDVRHPVGAEYATDGEHVYERIRDAEGRYSYRRAHWSKVIIDVEWLDQDPTIWEAIDENGVPKPGLT